MGTCSIATCTKPAAKRGWCTAHYKRWWRHGDPLAGRVDHGSCWTTLQSLLSLETDECVEWPHHLNDSGYGKVWDGTRSRRTHVIACETRNGLRPSSKHEVAHKCGNRSCLNYRHLRWATSSENNSDKVKHGTMVTKLSVEEVIQIRQRHKDRTGTYRGMAKEYGVSSVTIHNVISGKHWKGVV